jgi:hypothetical protein
VQPEQDDKHSDTARYLPDTNTDTNIHATRYRRAQRTGGTHRVKHHRNECHGVLDGTEL